MEKTLAIHLEEAYEKGWNDAVDGLAYEIKQLLEVFADDNAQKP